MKRLIRALVFSAFCCVPSSLVYTVGYTELVSVLIKIQLCSGKPIKTPSWLPNFLSITSHNIGQGVLQAIMMGRYSAFCIKEYNKYYSFFACDREHSMLRKDDDITGNYIEYSDWDEEEPSAFKSISAAMIIEGFNGMMIDNSLNRGGRLVKQRIQQWEKSHSPLHPALKWSLIRAGRPAGSFAWACTIGTLRTLKDTNGHWKLTSAPSLGAGIRLEVVNLKNPLRAIDKWG